jgi:hypothetical protein
MTTRICYQPKAQVSNLARSQFDRQSKIVDAPEANREPIDTTSTSETDPALNGIGDCVEKAARKIAGFAVGLVFGTSGLLVNAAAGGAEGLCHGSRIKQFGKAGFHTAFAANLALTGLAGGPIGIATGIVGGEFVWKLQGEQVRERVTQGADQWVDAVLAKLPGDPDQAGLPKRILQGAIGEVVGGAAGIVKGSLGLFKAGQDAGEQFVNRTFQEFRS